MCNNTPLTECKNEAERRANYSELCRLADVIQSTTDPGKVLKAIAWIIRQRKIEQLEQEAAQHGKEE